MISFEFGYSQVKLWYLLFCSMKIKEYMGPEFSGIFQLNLVAKNIVLRSPGTQPQAASAV